MSSTPEDGIQVTPYEARPDINGILRAKDEINAKLTADIAQAKADKDELRASLTQQKQENAIQGNIIDEQDVRIAELEFKLRRRGKAYRDVKRERDELETQVVILQRVVDESNASTSSHSSATDYDLMDRASDEEEDEDINGGNGTSSATDNNGPDNSSAANIKSEDETMDDI